MRAPPPDRQGVPADEGYVMNVMYNIDNWIPVFIMVLVTVIVVMIVLRWAEPKKKKKGDNHGG